jgi:hypothetical protein
MVDTKGLLNVAQHPFFAWSGLVGKLTRRHRALRPHRPEEGSGRESEFTRCLVALARPLIGALLEKHIT